MTDTKYNGWTNYETWNVSLWIDNEEGSQSYWADVAQEVWGDAEADDTFTRDENAVLELSERLKSEISENMPDLGASMWSDLLGAAMSEVNWHEIAEHFISDVDKTADDDSDDDSDE